MMVAVWTIAAALIVLLGLVLSGLVLFTARTARRIEQAVPPLGRFIEVDGARLHYLDRGAGQPLLLIHGLTGQMRHFTHSLLEPLERDYRVVIVDRPGSGYSTRPPGASAALADQACTIARFAKALGLEQPLVIGHSLGGAIALSLALNHPEQVGGLALVAPATHVQERAPAVFRALAIRSPLLRRIVAWTVATPLAIRNARAGLDAAFGPQSVPPDFATKGGGLLALRPHAFIAASSDLMAAIDDLPAMPTRYGSLNLPVGILFGTEDRLLDPAAHGATLAAKVPGVDLELIEGGGHMVPICSADRCVRFIARMARRAAAGVKLGSIT